MHGSQKSFAPDTGSSYSSKPELKYKGCVLYFKYRNFAFHLGESWSGSSQNFPTNIARVNLVMGCVPTIPTILTPALAC